MLSRSNKRGSYWYQANKCGRHPSPTVTNSILPLQQTNREKKDDAAYSHDSPIIILENKTTVDENWPECNELGGDGYSNERLKATSSAVLRPIVTVPRLPLKKVTTPTAHPPSSMSCSSQTHRHPRPPLSPPLELNSVRSSTNSSNICWPLRCIMSEIISFYCVWHCSVKRDALISVGMTTPH